MRDVSVNTPAFIYDEKRLLVDLGLANDICEETTARLLYSTKACSVFGVLELIANEVEGFACSSLFEARLGREVLGERGSIHITSPGLSFGRIK